MPFGKHRGIDSESATHTVHRTALRFHRECVHLVPENTACPPGRESPAASTTRHNYIKPERLQLRSSLKINLLSAMPLLPLQTAELPATS